MTTERRHAQTVEHPVRRAEDRVRDVWADMRAELARLDDLLAEITSGRDTDD